MFWAVSTLVLEIHQGFSSAFSSDFSMLETEIFPSLAFRNISATEIHLHFCCHSNIAKFIYISWTPRPLSIKRRRERADTRPSRIISQLNESDDLHSSCSSSTRKTTSGKLVYVDVGTRKRFGKYCSRFCFRILQISSFDSWLNCHQFKFQIFYSSHKYGGGGYFTRWVLRLRENQGNVNFDLTQSDWSINNQKFLFSTLQFI